MNAIEIENAIRQLPVEEARALVAKLHSIVYSSTKTPEECQATIAKWKGRFVLPAGKTVDDYIQIARDGDRD
jgi:hypothetical protein